MPISNDIKKWLLEEGNNFCALPFIHLQVDSDGAIKPCCRGTPIGLNIAGQSMGEVFDHPIRQEMVESFENNEQYKNCKVCWDDPTEFSSRVKYSMMKGAIDFTTDVYEGKAPWQELRWIELKAGNRCNLRCRICGDWNSSQWTKETHLHAEPHLPFKDSSAFKYAQSCNWIDDESFWTSLDGMENVRRFHIMGGEPFMVPEHMAMLKEFATLYPTNDVLIIYNTNGTIFPSEYLDILSQYRVHYQISIDDIGERFNYQRKNAVWEEVEKNIDLFLELRDDRVYVAIDPTISMFNVMYLQEFSSYMLERFGMTIGGRHFVQGQSPYNIRTLGPHCKELIRNRLSGGNSWVQQTVAFMDGQDLDTQEARDRRFELIRFLDGTRGENFQETFPEMWDGIKNER